MKGTIEIREIPSRALAANPLGDPAVRATPVYLPPGYAGSQKRYPVVYFLHGFGSGAMSFLNPAGFSLNVPERIDRLIDLGQLPPFIAVFVDGWTKLGGSQWLNSSALGNYSDYVVTDVVPWVDQSLRTVPQPSARAVVGKSSGGYGALVFGAHYPHVFGSVGCHSGDAYFEYGYLPEFPKAAGALRKSGGVEAWLKDFWARAQATRMRGEDHATINIVAMAAAYSPSPSAPAGWELPFELSTARIKPDVWEKWLSHDPVRFIPGNVASYQKLKGLFLDCGTRDEFHLQWGARMVCEEFRKYGVAVVYEEFEDGHMGINYRYDRSLMALVPGMS